MPILTADYQAAQTLSVTGLSTLANNGNVLSTAQTSADWADYLIRIQITTAAGATSGGTITIAVRGSIDGADFDDANNERVIATITLPASGIQSRSATFLLAGAEVLPPFWMLSFRNTAGDALTAATVKVCGVRTKTASETAAVFEEESVPVPDANSWYVATTGSDAAAGTIGAPFLTIGKAVDSAVASGTRKTIFVRGGTYRFTNHIYLASSAANLNIFGYPEETAIISGGEVVTGFTSDGNGLYSATVPGGATSLDLVIGGERQRCAQTGTFDPADPFRSGWLMADPVAVGSETTNQFKYRNTDLASVTVTAGMMAYVLESGALRATSVDILQGVTSINTTSKVVTLAGTTSGASAIFSGASYKLLNHPSFIRNEGEFAWNTTTSKLVVKPKSASFESLGVVVPRGPSSGHFFEMDAGANNVTFGNLTFANLPHSGAALFLYGATGLRVGGCTFQHVGNAVFITSGNNAVIAGNTFHSIADAGIVLTTNVLGAKIYANTFSDIGLIRKGGSAIYHGGASNSTIAYNDFFGMSRYSVSFKGAATNGHVHHTCRNNYVGRTNRETPDTGAIEFLNRDRVTFNALVSGNYIEDAGGFALTNDGTYEDRKYASCVYLDDLSSAVTITKNFMKGAAWGHVFIHGGDDNTIENNFSIIEPHETLVSTMHNNGNLTGDVVPERNNFQKNIYYSATTRSGSMWNLGGLGTGNVINNNVYHNIAKLAANPTANLTTADTTSVVADPLFVDPASGDYRLQGSSPAFAKGITNLDWDKMGRIGYTYAASKSETLPRFWRRWANSPVVNLDYTKRPSGHRIETIARASIGTYFNSRGVRVTAAVNEPRIDFNPATMEPRGLLLEPATTNLLTNSSDITNGAWTKADGATVASGQGTGLDGTNSLQSVAKVTDAGSLGNGKLSTFINSFAAGSPLTASVYLKKGTMDWAYVTIWAGDFSTAKAAWFNLAAGTIGTVESGGTTISGASAAITHMGRGIYRCTLSVQTNTITTGQLQISGDVGDTTFWGTAGGTILFGGAQVETQAAATSLVVTTNGIASRSADTLDIPLAPGSYDVVVADSAGSELRTGRSPSGGLHRVTPRSGQTHVSRVQAYYTGASFFLPTLQAGAFTTKVGDGTTSLDTTANSMTIAFGTTATSLRAAYGPLQVGQRYRVAWSVSNSNGTQGQAGFGTSIGGPQYQPTLAGVTGANTFDFDAVSDTLYPTFQRASTGSSTFSALSVTRIAPVTWQAISPQPITPSTWTALSSGVTVNGTTGTITIPATGTLLSAAGSVTTTIGKRYRLVFTVGGNTIAAQIGTAQGGSTLKVSTVVHAVGSHTYEFVATTTTTWIQFQRQTSGTATVSGISLQEIIA